MVIFNWITVLLSLVNTVFVLATEAGQTCNPYQDDYHILPNTRSAFLACDIYTRRWVQRSCASIASNARQFSKALQYCVQSDFTGSRQVGETCSYNTDCVSGGYCNGQYCTCQSAFVPFNGYCYEKRNPGEGGCLGNIVGDRQCTAVWPNTKCISGTCVCCSDSNNAATCNLPVVQTRDGAVCLNANGECPLGGAASKLMTVGLAAVACARNTNGQVTGCDPSDTGTPPTSTMNLYYYDCIQDAAAAFYCCPNRAAACMQPKIGEVVTGGANSATRWYFNSVSGTCLQFQWDTIGGTADATLLNANNFVTQDHCLAYCALSCDRGSPEYLSNIVQQQQNKRTCSAGGSVCDTLHECVTRGSDNLCCPLTSFICSSQGGVVVPDNSAVVEQGFQCGNSFSSNRFRYNPSIQRCEPIPGQYLGCGGTFNNFESQQDCETFCQGLVCPRGQPLKDANGGFLSCGGSVACASTHHCYNGFCCPNKQTVCSEVKVIGQCSSFQTRYWFNPATQQCESFYYSGCQGNDNNFETAQDCQNFCRGTTTSPQCIQGSAYRDLLGNYAVCSNSGLSNQQCPVNYECYFNGNSFGCCPTKDYVCSLTSSAGLQCGPLTTRWFFDANTQTCQTFEYHGCDGNPNNFPNQDLCKQYCGVGNCPYGGQPYRDGSGVVRVCGSNAGSCPSEHDCTAVQFGTSTVNYCCPRRSYVCRLPPLTGTSCGQSVTRWYYNFALKSCAQFTYGGCSGNANSFFTQQQCIDFCASSACLAGEVALMTNNVIQTCNPALGSSSCASGYFCRSDTTSGSNNICCGSGTQGVCPLNTRAYVDPFEGAARKCVPSNINSCPGDFLCILVAAKQSYYCCSPSGGLCPAGQQAFSDTSTGASVKCLLNTFNNCPTNYQCQSAIAGSLFGYCCSTSVTAQCPSGTVAYTDSTNRPVSCTVGVTVCPDSRYVCQATIAGSITGFCCSTNSIVSSEVCPDGYKPTRNPYLSAQFYPMPCFITGPRVCYGYSTCMYRPGNIYAYCCELDNAAAKCPNGYELQKVNGLNKELVPISCAVEIPYSCTYPYQCLKYNGDAPLAFCCKPLPTTTTILTTATPTTTTTATASATKATLTTTITKSTASTAPLTTALRTVTSTCRPYKPVYNLCPTGQVQYTLPGTNTPQTCQTFTQPNGCPSGFFCQYNPTTAQSYCCALDVGCPTASFPSIDPSTGQPQSCTGVSSCANGFTCVFSAKQSRNICCSSSAVTPTIQFCPVNSSPLLISGTSSATPCTVGSTVCPQGYTCQSANAGSATYCCSGGSTTTTTYCPANSQPYFFPQTTTPQSCALGTNTCPSAYSCQQGSSGTFCCSGGSTPTNYCPTNTTPFYFQGTQSVQICQLGTNTCSQGYSCQRGPSGQDVCCSSSQPTTNFCPVNTTPYFSSINQQPVSCTVGSSVCPASYTCQLGPSGIRYCCSGGGSTVTSRVCPNNNQPYYFPGTMTPRTCTIGASGNCDLGYTCQRSPADSFSYCCKGTSGVPGSSCPSGSSPFLYPGTQLPLGCPNGGQCPPTSTCQNGVCCIQSYFAPSNGQAGLVSSSSTVSGVCPVGTSPELYPGLGTPLGCPNGGHCPPTSTCQNGVCCSLPSFASVKTSLTFDASCSVMQQGVFCDPNGRSAECASTFSCTFNKLMNSYRCCQTGLKSFRRRNEAYYSRQRSMTNYAPGCPMNTVKINNYTNNISTCLPRLKAGDVGCLYTLQCQQGQCIGAVCKCPTHKLLFIDKCVSMCPLGLENRHGVCIPV